MVNNNIKILDPEGININQLTQQPYSNEYKELAKKWSKLPVYEKAEEITDAIKKNNVLIILSFTGSGKSILVPALTLYAIGYDKKIAMTLPKQIIAKSVAEFSAKLLDVPLGEIIGYKYKGSDKRYYKDTNRILYATDGTIVAMLLRDSNLSLYDAILIDEAHERKIQIDFLLYLLKNVVEKRPEFKLIIMSATVDKKIFENYFSNVNVATIDVGGTRGFPIESIFLKHPIGKSQYLEKGFEIIKKLISDKKEENKDIIFFVPSIKETFEICKKLENEKDDFCVEVYAGIDNEKQIMAQDKDMFKSAYNKKRKIVMATNVAESSLTIDNLKIVIDSGMEVKEYFDPKIGSRILEKQLITRAQANQRMGRTGRTSSGTCYHLYTEEEFNNMLDYPEPAIKTSNIYSECLKFLALPMVKTTEKLEDILNNLIDPPRENFVKYSLNILLRLGLIDGEKITELGEIVANIELDPEQALTVYASYRLYCFYEVVGIISIIESIKGNINELFIKPNEENAQLMKKFNKAKNSLLTSDSDHLTLLKIFIKYSEYRKKKQFEKMDNWIYVNFLKKTSLEKAHNYYKRVIYKILDDIKKIEMPKLENVNDYELKHRILASFSYGYKTNYAHLNSHKKYNSMLVENINMDKDSFMNSISMKKEILYNDLLTMSGKTNMLVISSIPNKTNEILEKYF